MLPLRVRHLGTVEYQDSWRRMAEFTRQRRPDTVDELWFLEHFPVFTQGQAGKAEHLLDPHDVPVVRSDRGGQITYHGPGQLVAYPLLNLSRLQIGVRDLVQRFEQILIDTLAVYKIAGERREKAPGVYVNNAKIAALGLRVRHGYTLHGLSVNVAMDLTPFSWINPCGYSGLAVTQISDFFALAQSPEVSHVAQQVLQNFCRILGYTIINDAEETAL